MLNYILVYINIILINILLFNCYNINDYGFYTLNFVIFLSMGVYYIFSQIIKKIPKKTYKFLFIMAFLSFASYIIYLNREHLYEFILDLNNKALYLINAIYSRRIIEFSEIRSLWFILLPIVIWIFMMLCKRKLQIIIIILTLALGFYLNYAGFRAEFINDINLFAFILIFDIVVIYFMKRYLKTIENENELEVNYRSIVFIATFVFISFAVFMAFNASDLSVKYESNIASFGSDLNTNIRDFFKITDSKKLINDTGSSLISFNNNEVVLGGDLNLDDGLVLTLNTNGSIKYLRARTRDYYSGYSWMYTFKSYSSVEKDMTIQYPPTLTDIFDARINLSQYGNKRLVSPLYSYQFDNDKIKYNTNDFTIESSSLNMSYSFKYYNGGIIYDDSYKGAQSEYLELPPNIPKSLINLTHEIIKDARTPEEKVNKIVNYLRTNCKYSLDVNPVPNNREFVDYFVTTSKKGYCTYFATSTVVMLRIAGLESRYVEGYLVKNNIDENGSYIVTNRDAHAWAEVRTGINMWVTVDAVPEVETLDNQFAQNNVPIQLAPTEQTFANKTSALKQNNSTDINESNSVQSNKSMSLLSIIKSFGSLKWYMKAPLIIIFIFIAFLIYKYLSKVYRKNKFINSKNINYCHIYFLSHLNKIGYKKTNNETNLEFSETIQDEEIKNTFLNFIYKFNREVYGNKKVDFTKEDRVKLFDYINQFYIDNTKLYNRIFSF
ncbi:MAG: transglutaminase-like domain-containing protein [Oscillospiraceae bacterium]|nr:transglutaminase-like domain-containing protein [Oscillospiraceae bacterium]